MVISKNITQTQLPVEQKINVQPQVTEQKDKVEIGTNKEKPAFILTEEQKKELKKLAQDMGINLEQEGITLTEEQKKELTDKAISEFDRGGKVAIAGASLFVGGFSGIRGFLCGLVGLGAGAVAGSVGVGVATVAMAGYGLYKGLRTEKGLWASIKYYHGFRPTPEEKVTKAVIRCLTDAASTASGGLLGSLGATFLAPLITGTPAGIKTAVELSHGLNNLEEAIIQELNSPKGKEAEKQVSKELEK